MEENSVSVSCVGLVRAMPPNLACKLEVTLHFIWRRSTGECRDQFCSDDQLKGQEAWADIWHGASEVARSTC